MGVWGDAAQVRKLFQQLFSFVNVQLFNQLLLRRECCSFSNGEYVKTGLAEVENWIHAAGKDWVGESWDELRYIRQVGACVPEEGPLPLAVRRDPNRPCVLPPAAAEHLVRVRWMSAVTTAWGDSACSQQG